MDKSVQFFKTITGLEVGYASLSDSQKQEIDIILGSLTPRQKIIISRFYGLGTNPQTERKIAECLSIKPQRVLQTRKKALGRLNQRPNRFKLLQILGLIESNTDSMSNALESLDLPTTFYNALVLAGVNSLEDLTQKTEDWVMRQRNLGRTALNKLKDIMMERGLEFQPGNLPATHHCPKCGHRW